MDPRLLVAGMTEQILRGLPSGRNKTRSALGNNKANFALSLIGFRTGGSPAMGAEVFIETSGREH
jgi:hypothetical protein